MSTFLPQLNIYCYLRLTIERGLIERMLKKYCDYLTHIRQLGRSARAAAHMLP